MLTKFIAWVRWRIRNDSAIEELRRQRNDLLVRAHKQMWCELHGSYDCSHSTWSLEVFANVTKSIRDDYKARVVALE